MGEELDLLDWRRRVFALYAEVRDRDPRSGHARWRAGREELIRTHPQSPLEPDRRSSFTGPRYFDYDPALRFEVALSPRHGERVTVDTSGGELCALRRLGTIELPVGALDVYWVDVYGGGLFVPFRDATCGRTTYGGGRYLLDTIKGADLGSTPEGRLIVDFNFAYHPSCHYSHRWACPLATADSTLSVAIEAGERV